MRQELNGCWTRTGRSARRCSHADYYKLLYQREFGCGHTAPRRKPPDGT